MPPYAILFFCLSAASHGAGDSPEAQSDQVANAYLRAVSDTGDAAGRDLLLGGATFNAQLLTLENWRILSSEPVRREDGNLGEAAHLMSELDRAGRSALAKMMKEAKQGNDLTLEELSQEQAAKLLTPTKERSEKFLRACPLLAYLTRVGKEVYWHPQNPMRMLLRKAGTHGPYTVELRRYKIESKEGPRQVPREWPLRILRFRGGNIDTGWKILPASDWNAE
jgi:hypothetical protein